MILSLFKYWLQTFNYKAPSSAQKYITSNHQLCTQYHRQYMVDELMLQHIIREKKANKINTEYVLYILAAITISVCKLCVNIHHPLWALTLARNCQRDPYKNANKLFQKPYLAWAMNTMYYIIYLINMCTEIIIIFAFTLHTVTLMHFISADNNQLPRLTQRRT